MDTLVEGQVGMKEIEKFYEVLEAFMEWCGEED